MRKKTIFWLTAIFVFIPILFSSPSSLFAQACDTVAVTQARTEIQRDPHSLAVLADTPSRRSKCAVYTDMNEAGYFKIFVDTKNDLDQPNESYFMTVKYSDGTLAPLCDPNLGSWKVVPDTLVSDTTGLRYAGTFYFQNGVNQIILNHYAIIVEDYPDFWIGPSDSASIINGSANSVHVTQIVLEKVALDGYDLSVTYSAKTDTSLPINGNTEQVVPVGGSYSYQLNLEGLGTQITNDVKLWMVPPDSVQLSNFNIQPSGAHSDTLYWIFNEVGAGQKISITYDAKVAAALPATPFLLFSKCAVGAGCESDTTNNTAEATVYAISRENYFATDIGLTQTVQTDTSLVINGNLEPVVPAGKNYSGHIKVGNKGPKIAGDLILWLVPPDSVNLINFNIPPDYSSGDTLFWRFSGIKPGQQIDITFQVHVFPHLPSTPFPLLLESHVDYPFDTDTSNNSAEDTVYAIDPLTVWGTDISLTQTVRTDSSMEINGSEEQVVPVSGQFDYELHVKNQGPNPAGHVTLWAISPDSVQLHNFNIPPSRISGDTLFWVFDNLPLGQQINITSRADVSPHLPNTPFPLLLESHVDYPFDTDTSNNSAEDTVYVVDSCSLFQPGAPQIKTDKTLIEVGDSVTVRVSLPDGVISWDLWVRYVDGTIDSSFADDFITNSPLTANQWLTIKPLFSNTRLITSAEHENVIFELRTVDKCHNARVAQISVTIKSSNDCLLDRNVFKPGSAAALGILFKLSSNRTAKLDLYDVTGYHVTKITEGPFNAGWNKYLWNGLTTDGQPVGSGLYIVTIRSGNFYCWKKVIIVR